ncbi:hypothetical protein [Alkalimarinus sediminis]|uniref:Uncharacterized protein n=1 Tax=Alkalimarinus sediminis TaxID=1632866 RepID=A0A9E8KPD9_9ALTE|nr:hypothetical protein [Alkalimarinus sediminis]UZW74644.1 hypothetical protein NNL22_16735 [Alkalimarinus sediminis]
MSVAVESRGNETDWATTLLAPNMDEFCEVKRDQRVVKPKRLLLWLLDFVAISDAAMDLNGDGNTLYNEKVALIADDKAFAKCIESSRCDELDQEKVLRIRSVIESLWSPSPPNPFRTHFLPGREGSASKIELSSFLTQDSDIESVCPAPDRVFTPQSELEDESSNESSWLDRVVVREKSDDITKPFDEAGPANFSFEKNELSSTRDIEVDLVVAYLVHERYREKESSQYFLYFQSDTDIQKIDGEDTSSSRSALSLGLLAEYRLGKYEQYYFSNHVISLRPSYTKDAVQESESANIIASWTPIPDLGKNNFFLNMVPVGPYVSVKLNWDARLEGGWVLQEGDQEIFDDNNDYADVGANFNFLVAGAKNSLLERFQWDSNYKKLFSLIADQPNKEYLSSKLRYFINGNFSVGLEFEKGRKGVQFNEVDKWKINFGAKY